MADVYLGIPIPISERDGLLDVFEKSPETLPDFARANELFSRIMSSQSVVAAELVEAVTSLLRPFKINVAWGHHVSELPTSICFQVRKSRGLDIKCSLLTRCHPS